MSYTTYFSTFLSNQLRSMDDADKKQFRSKMEEIRTGTLSHHKVLQGTAKGSTKVLKKAGKTGISPSRRQAASIGGKSADLLLPDRLPSEEHAGGRAAHERSRAWGDPGYPGRGAMVRPDRPPRRR